MPADNVFNSPSLSFDLVAFEDILFLLVGVLSLSIGFKLIDYGIDRRRYGIVALAFPLFPFGLSLLFYIIVWRWLFAHVSP